MTQQQQQRKEKQQQQQPQKESFNLNITTMQSDEIASNTKGDKLISNNRNNETITTMINERKNETNQLLSLNIHNLNGVNETTIDAKKLNKKLQEEDLSKLFQEAVEFGLKSAKDLKNIKEPLWYQMGLFLEDNHPAVKVAKFGGRFNEKSSNIAQFGFAAEEAFKKFTKSLPEELSRHGSEFIEHFQSKQLADECPLRRPTRCTPASLRYRTSDGTCNNLRKPWRGAAMLPYQRFLPPTYDDGIQSVRRSVFGNRLPSARDISVRFHRDKDIEIESVTLMFTQWGQFLDHDVTSTVKSRSFNGSIPRCCERGGVDVLPPELTHPNCLPITVSEDDWFLDRFGIRCIEFTRSAPSTRIDCDLGWREQINQVTPFIDASTIYGSDVETSDSTRTFRNGKLIYGRDPNSLLQPPDPPGGELCRSGALTSDCFQAGDGRVDEQPGLTALHTIFIRYHNKVATSLSKLNRHWSDEKIFQETRKIVYSVIQHITYREYLPLVLGKEVIDLFELDLERKGYYTKYDPKVNPAIANSFSAAAFRFGHSMVQNSYVRFDSFHRPLFNNVSLHEELDNLENIWSFGSLDRTILGFCNQASQRRDEFIADELTNHLFQSGGAPFGMDLAAINIQRGRDHGIPAYTNWRKPCGLSSIESWSDLERIMSFESVQRLRSLYHHVDDIDLYSGGLAEKPVRGGIVGPTFACIIAQQFLNLRKGDRFWYENGDFESSFTPAQLQQIRKVSLAQVLCETLPEIRTIQPFVFLSNDNFRNLRTSCEEFKFDFLAWTERQHQEQDDNDVDVDTKLEFRQAKKVKKNVKTTTTTKRPTATRKTTPKPKKEKPLKIPILNITTTTVKLENKYGSNSLNSNYGRPVYYQYDNIRDVTYLVGTVPDRTTPYYQSSSMTQQQQVQQQKPIEVNIKIQYYLPTTTRPTTTTKKPKRKKRPTSTTYRPYYDNNVVLVTSKPQIVTARPPIHYDNYPIFLSNNNPYDKTTTKRPYHVFPSNTYNYDRPDFNRPIYDSTTQRPHFQDIYYSKYTTKRPTNFYNRGDEDVNDNIYTDSFNSIPKRPSFGTSTTTSTFHKPTKIYAISHIEKLDKIEDKLDFKTRFIYKNKDADQDKRYIKISSVKAGAFVHYPESKEGVLDLEYENGDSRHLLDNSNERIRVVDIEVSPSEIKKDQWMVYNVTEEETPQFIMPDINVNISCTNEIPQPINMTRRNDF